MLTTTQTKMDIDSIFTWKLPSFSIWHNSQGYNSQPIKISGTKA